MGTWVHSACYTGPPDFLCRLRDRSYVVGSTQHAPGHSGFAWSSMRRCLGQQPVNTPEISEGSTFSNLREVIMTMSEYEERFRPPAPSLHQTFTEVRGPNRGGRRSRRLWVSAALVGVMTITSNRRQDLQRCVPARARETRS